MVIGILLSVQPNYTDLTVVRGAPTKQGCIRLLLSLFRLRVTFRLCTCVLQCVRLTVLAIGRRCKLSAMHILVFAVCILPNKELLEFGKTVTCCIRVLGLLYTRTLRVAITLRLSILLNMCRVKLPSATGLGK